MAMCRPGRSRFPHRNDPGFPIQTLKLSRSPLPACCVTLFAGQAINSGSVTVGNDDDYLYVTFSARSPLLLSETHLHVADSLASIPQNKKGDPKVGNFAYQRSYDPLVAEDTYVIAKSDLSLDATTLSPSPPTPW